MPTAKPALVPPLRGEPAYAAYLDELEAEAARRGHPPGRTALAELARARLGKAWGLKAPRRIAPKGTNRYGEPK